MRMTVATCVMLLELTNNLALLPLMMLVTLVAKVRRWDWVLVCVMVDQACEFECGELCLLCQRVAWLGPTPACWLQCICDSVAHTPISCCVVVLPSVVCAAAVAA